RGRRRPSRARVDGEACFVPCFPVHRLTPGRRASPPEGAASSHVPDRWRPPWQPQGSVVPPSKNPGWTGGMAVRVLGIDPGTATMGFGIVAVSGTTLVPVAYGVIRTPAGQPAAL